VRSLALAFAAARCLIAKYVPRLVRREPPGRLVSGEKPLESFTLRDPPVVALSVAEAHGFVLVSSLRLSVEGRVDFAGRRRRVRQRRHRSIVARELERA
jgi:hypothetical protein